MEVRYTVSLNDFVALSLYLNRKSGAGRTGYLVAWLGLPIFCAAGAVWLLQSDCEPLAVGLAGLAAFWLIIFPYRFRDAPARNVRTHVKNLGGRGIIGERAVILSEEKLVAISETFRTEVRWENMTGVEVVGECTYVFISGISALILPRHGFATDEEYEAVRDFALRKLADKITY
jgi:hypothetical protein